MTKTISTQARTQAACLALAFIATVATVSGVDAMGACQVRTAQALAAARADVVQTASAQTVVVVGRRIAKA